jgi:hypothetical protein
LSEKKRSREESEAAKPAEDDVAVYACVRAAQTSAPPP